MKRLLDLYVSIGFWVLYNFFSPRSCCRRNFLLLNHTIAKDNAGKFL